MGRLKKSFSRELLIKIHFIAGYYGGSTHQIAEKLGIGVATWHRWKLIPEVQRAIAAGRKRRWNQILKSMNVSPELARAEFQELSKQLDDFVMELNDSDFPVLEDLTEYQELSDGIYLDGAFEIVVETKIKKNGSTSRTVTKRPCIQPAETFFSNDRI